MNVKDVDIIITTYNSSLRIERLLKSIQQQTHKAYRCFAIDDHSQDDTVAFIENQFPWVQVITQSKNHGPARNRNIAARLGVSPYIVFFDDDVFLEDEEWLQKAVAIMENNLQIGQLASRIISGYDDDILLDCGIHGDGKTFGGIFWRKSRHHVFGKHLVSRRVIGACSAGTIIRRAVFDKVGGFDPTFYYLAEDADLSIKIHLLGYDVIYEPALVTYHYETQAMGTRLLLKQYLMYRNCLQVLLKHYPIRHIFRTLSSLYLPVLKSLLRCIGVRLLNHRALSLELAPHIRYAIKAFGYVFTHFPHIMLTRWRMDRIRQRTRQYLLDVNDQLENEIRLHLPIRQIIFSVTNACNARCRMCFQYKELNKKLPLLSLDEIKKMFCSFNALDTVVLGGGEPFLRKDIEEICFFLIQRFQHIAITLPTNGSLPETTYETTKNILAYGCRSLTLSLSLDGMQSYHDANRGIGNLFHTVQMCYEKLVHLKKIFRDQLNIQVNTCVTEENLEQIDLLAEHISQNMPEATWVIEPLRGSFDTSKIHPFSYEQWEALYKKIGQFPSSPSWNNNSLKKTFEFALRVLREKTQIVPCCAAVEFISIDFQGNIFTCEILAQPSINIRDINYDINQLLICPEWNMAAEAIRQKKCYCTHFCWLTYSLSKHNMYE